MLQEWLGSQTTGSFALWTGVGLFLLFVAGAFGMYYLLIKSSDWAKSLTRNLAWILGTLFAAAMLFFLEFRGGL